MTAIEAVQTVPLTQTPEGVIRVTGTRVPLDTILHHYKQGASAEEITNRFPAVSLCQVHAVLAYYLSHRAELDAYLQKQEEADAAFQKQLEADPQYQADRVAFRERLMRRWAERQTNGIAKFA
ncbi:MAG: DUF433 domain-containing protein [Acidobacteria bacterium]|nr:DUF433 domain-containing protein [Acidobacteriota bacterium]MBI3423294.1 DUF433 domain-containing protein [Acidobacteriota bacterium]